MAGFYLHWYRKWNDRNEWFSWSKSIKAAWERKISEGYHYKDRL